MVNLIAAKHFLINMRRCVPVLTSWLSALPAFRKVAEIKTTLVLAIYCFSVVSPSEWHSGAVDTAALHCFPAKATEPSGKTTSFLPQDKAVICWFSCYKKNHKSQLGFISWDINLTISIYYISVLFRLYDTDRSTKLPNQSFSIE